MLNVYLDTCVLPVRGEVRGGALSPLRALQKQGAIQLVIPRLVLDEFRNLRTSGLEDAIRRIRRVYRSAFGNLEEGLFVPSVEDAILPELAELESEIEVIETDPQDAAEALRREVLRTAPARLGRGGRDAAIWLSIVRHHRSSSRPGLFVTSNTADYCDHDHLPLPRLIEDLNGSSAQFRFSFSVAEAIELVAPVSDPQMLPALDEQINLRADIAHAVATFLDIDPRDSGLDKESGVSRWEILDSDFLLTDLVVLEHRSLEGTDNYLVKASVRTAARMYSSDSFREFEVICWLEVFDGTIEMIEHLRVSAR